MEDKLLTVVIPIYNVEEYINRCIESVVNQTYTNLEIILVDDGSTDNCPAICDEWKRKDARIRVIHQDNKGLSDARNRGINEAKGKYLLFVDSDDYLELDACLLLANCIQKTDCDFVVGNLKEIHFDTGTSFVQKHTNLPICTAIVSKEYIIKSIEASEWYAPAVLNLYKRNFIVENDLLFKSGRVYEDIEILPRLCLSAKRIAYIDYTFYNYCIHKDSITNSCITKIKVESAIKNYSDWKRTIDKVEDGYLRKTMYGALIKYYLKTCKDLHIISWSVAGVDFGFSLRNALNFKEKIKVLAFNFFPKIYLKI